MIKSCKEEFDRLMETSPIIPDKIINKFTKTFKKNDNYLLIKKPEICDSLESIELAVYRPDQTAIRKTNYKELINDVLMNINQVSAEEALNMKYTIIDTFITNFKKEMSRRPTKQEIMHNVESDDLQITESIIDSYLAKHTNIVEDMV